MRSMKQALSRNPKSDAVQRRDIHKLYDTHWLSWATKICCCIFRISRICLPTWDWREPVGDARAHHTRALDQTQYRKASSRHQRHRACMQCILTKSVLKSYLREHSKLVFSASLFAWRLLAARRCTREKCPG